MENETATPVETTAITPEEKKALFQSYSEADEEWLEAKALLDAKAKKRSQRVQEIHNKLGKGPFGYRGDVLKVVQRGETFFFRGKRDHQIEEIG